MPGAAGGEASPFSFIRVRSIAAAVFLCSVAMLWASARLPHGEGGAADAWLGIALYGATGALLALQCRRSGVALRRLFGAVPLPAQAWRIAARAFPLLAFSVGAFWLLFLPLSLVLPAFVEEWLSEPGPPVPNALAFVSVAVAAPLCEEFVFRGLILHRWAEKWDLRRSVIGSSVAFGLLHAEPLSGIAFGLVAAVVYLETRSLWAAVILHAANNALVFAVALAIEGLGDGTDAAMTLAELRSYAWVGGLGLLAGGPWLVVFLRRHWRPGAWALPCGAP